MSMLLQNKTEQEKRVWESFVDRFSLNEKQQQQFLTYLSYLIQENKKFNITAIVDFESIVRDHFIDALVLSEKMDLKLCASIIDVGTGGGLPGIPLKILYPRLQVLLIEVNQKKVLFLQEIIEKLSLENISVCDQDWRSFLRSYEEKPDVVIARASLSVEELQRMFKGSSALQHATLVYWASKYWNATQREAEFLDREESYSVNHKLRRLIFFRKSSGE